MISFSQINLSVQTAGQSETGAMRIRLQRKELMGNLIHADRAADGGLSVRGQNLQAGRGFAMGEWFHVMGSFQYVMIHWGAFRSPPKPPSV